MTGLYKEDSKAAEMSKNSDRYGLDKDDLWKSKSLDKVGSKFADEAYGFDRYPNDKLYGRTYRAAEPSYLPDQPIDKGGYYSRRPSAYDHRSYFDRSDRYYRVNRSYENKYDSDQNYDNSSPADGAPPTSFGGNSGAGRNDSGSGNTIETRNVGVSPAASDLISFESPENEFRNNCHKALEQSELPTSSSYISKNGMELDTLVSQNPERMPLATAIVNDIISGGKAETYKEAIADLSSDDRLQLAKDLHATADEYNQLLGLRPGVDKEALVVDARVGKEDENVNDIDVLRGFSSVDEPERTMERIDLYDPNSWRDSWSGLKEEGAEADKKQALDAVTAPYETLAQASLTAAIEANKGRPNDTVRLREENKRNLEGHDDKAAERMLIDLNLEAPADAASQDRAEELRNNLKRNFANPDSAMVTENTRPLFEASAEAARKELRPSRDLQCDVWRYKAGFNSW